MSQFRNEKGGNEEEWNAEVKDVPREVRVNARSKSVAASITGSMSAVLASSIKQRSEKE